MRDATLREQKDRLLEPMAQQLFTSIHPNTISVVAMGVGIQSVAAVISEVYWAGLILWGFNRILDGLDGEESSCCWSNS